MKCVVFVLVWVVTSSAYPYSHLARIRGRRIPNPRQIYSNQDMLLRTEQQSGRRSELRRHKHLPHNPVNPEVRNPYGADYHQTSQFHDSRLPHQPRNLTATRKGDTHTRNMHTHKKHEHGRNSTNSATTSRHGNTHLFRQPQRQQLSAGHNFARILSNFNQSLDRDVTELVRPSMTQQTEEQPRVRASLYLSDNSAISQPENQPQKSTPESSNVGIPLRTAEPNPSAPIYHQSSQNPVSQLGAYRENVFSQGPRIFPQRERPQPNVYRGLPESAANNQASSQQLSSRAQPQAPFVNPDPLASSDDTSTHQQTMFSNHPRNNQQVNAFPYFSSQPNNRLYPNLQSMQQQYYGSHDSYSNFASARQPHFNYQNAFQPYMNGQQPFTNGDATQGHHNFAPLLGREQEHSVTSNQNTLESSNAHEGSLSSDERVGSLADKSPAEAIANQYDTTAVQQPGSQTPLHVSVNAQANSFQPQEANEVSESNEQRSNLPRTIGLNAEGTSQQVPFVANQAAQHFLPRASDLANNVESNYMTGSLPDGQPAYFNGALPDTNQQPSYLGNNNDVIPFNQPRQHHVTSQPLSYLSNQPESNNHRLFLRPSSDGQANSFHSTRDVPITVNRAHRYNSVGGADPQRSSDDSISHEENERNSDELKGGEVDDIRPENCESVTCPQLLNCVNSTRVGCCSVCSKLACPCEGYQRYDCISNGFNDGLVPEGESYTVDMGSTTCSCPKGGGAILCSFRDPASGPSERTPRILCPPTPPYCVETYTRPDTCVECASVGCVGENGEKHQAGSRLRQPPCTTCVCPDEGGELACLVDQSCEDSRNGGDQPHHTSLALESTLRVMRDPLAGEPTLNKYDKHDIEDGYDTRFLQPDWNSFSQDTQKPESEQTSQQAVQSEGVFGNQNNFNPAPNPPRINSLIPSNISPPQPAYGDNFRKAFPFQSQLPPYSGQVLPKVENQHKLSGYNYPQSETRKVTEPLPENSNQVVSQHVVQEADNNSSSASLQNTLVNPLSREQNVLRPNLLDPNANNPKFPQKFFPYSYENYQPENQKRNFDRSQPLWPAANFLHGSNQFGSDQSVPNSYPNPGYPRFFQPSQYYSNHQLTDNQQIIISDQRVPSNGSALFSNVEEMTRDFLYEINNRSIESNQSRLF